MKTSNKDRIIQVNNNNNDNNDNNNNNNKNKEINKKRFKWMKKEKRLIGSRGSWKLLCKRKTREVERIHTGSKVNKSEKHHIRGPNQIPIVKGNHQRSLKDLWKSQSDASTSHKAPY